MKQNRIETSPIRLSNPNRVLKEIKDLNRTIRATMKRLNRRVMSVGLDIISSQMLLLSEDKGNWDRKSSNNSPSVKENRLSLIRMSLTLQSTSNGLLNKALNKPRQRLQQNLWKEMNQFIKCRPLRTSYRVIKGRKAGEIKEGVP